MPLAAPLILPFAELAGITIAGLGMAAASKKVSDFISANPETSMEILNMIVPGSKGLETLFKKKASVTLEDVENMTDEEAQDLSDEDIAGVMNEAGKSKGPGKRERMIEISRKLGLSGEGKERKKIIDDIDARYDEGGVEDAPKPKFDYKKFIRNRNADGGRIGFDKGGIFGSGSSPSDVIDSDLLDIAFDNLSLDEIRDILNSIGVNKKADGGAIGIEVLFEEKKDGGRIGYQSGGGLMDIETEFGLQAPKGTISFDDYLGGLYNSDKVGALQNLAVKDYAQGDYTKTASGPISDFRHRAAMNELSKSFSPGPVPNIIGDTIAFGAGLINEIPALGRGVDRENLREIGEDIFSNFKGTYGTSNKRTPEEIYDSIFNPRTTVVSSPNLTYGTAAAADFKDGEMLQAPTSPVRADYERAPNAAFAELLSQNVTNPELTRKFDKSPAPLGIMDRLKQGVGSVFDTVRNFSPVGIVGGLLSNLDRFDTLSAADQDFITSQGLGQDKYGYNKRSAFGNYANLVKERARIAANRRAQGLQQRAIDDYYEKLEKERQAALQQQIQNAISEGRSMQQSYEDHFSNMGYSSPAERAADTPTGTLGRI